MNLLDLSKEKLYEDGRLVEGYEPTPSVMEAVANSNGYQVQTAGAGSASATHRPISAFFGGKFLLSSALSLSSMFLLFNLYVYFSNTNSIQGYTEPTVLGQTVQKAKPVDAVTDREDLTAGDYELLLQAKKRSYELEKAELEEYRQTLLREKVDFQNSVSSEPNTSKTYDKLMAELAASEAEIDAVLANLEMMAEKLDNGEELSLSEKLILLTAANEETAL